MWKLIRKRKKIPNNLSSMDTLVSRYLVYVVKISCEVKCFPFTVSFVTDLHCRLYPFISQRLRHFWAACFCFSFKVSFLIMNVKENRVFSSQSIPIYLLFSKCPLKLGNKNRMTLFYVIKHILDNLKIANRCDKLNGFFFRPKRIKTRHDFLN